MSGILVGVTEGGVSTPIAHADTGSRVSHFLATLRDSFGNYAEAVRRFPEVGRILDQAARFLSGGVDYQLRALPAEQLFCIFAVSPAPTLQVVQPILAPHLATVLTPGERKRIRIGKMARKVNNSACVTIPKLSRVLDAYPAWDTCESPAAAPRETTRAPAGWEGLPPSTSLPWED